MNRKFSRFRPLTDEEEAEIQRMIADDPDDSDITEEDMRNARPFREAHPELAAKMEADRAARQRMASAAPANLGKQQVSLRLSGDVLTRLRGMGRGWQSKVDDILRKAVGL